MSQVVADNNSLPPVEAPAPQPEVQLSPEDQREIDRRMLKALGNGGAGDVGMSEHEVRKWVVMQYLKEKENVAKTTSPEVIQGVIRQAGASVLVEPKRSGDIDANAADAWC